MWMFGLSQPLYGKSFLWVKHHWLVRKFRKTFNILPSYLIVCVFFYYYCFIYYLFLIIGADIEQVKALYSEGYLLSRPELCPKDLYQVDFNFLIPIYIFGKEFNLFICR